MSKGQTIAPFLTAPQDTVIARPWMLQDPKAEPLPAILSEWDSATDLRLSRTVSLDVAKIWAACGLAVDDKIGIAAEWISEGTSLRGCTAVAATECCRDVELRINVYCSGAELGQALVLRTRLVLLPGRGTAESKVAPRRVTSILWRDEERTVLEGQGSRFPMETIDFSQLPGAPPDASWHLVWMAGDLELPLTAATRLYLNVCHPAVIEAVTKAEPDKAEQIIRRVILWDVARRLVIGVLDNAEYSGDTGGYAPGSLGQAVTSLIDVHLGESPEGLRALRKTRPAVFESVIQAAFDPIGRAGS